METIAFITGIVAISVIFYYILKEYSYSQFQKTMEEGDECMIIQNGHKVYGNIQYINEDTTVYIHTIYGKYTREKEEVYPAKTIII
jgi:hypothetical protein